jgi:hypothetical protein
MIAELPIHYAIVFFLGMLVYTPITLISNGKYKAGMKAAAAISVSLLMLATTARLATTIYPSAARANLDSSRVQEAPVQTTAFAPSQSNAQFPEKRWALNRRTKSRRNPNQSASPDNGSCPHP